MHSERLSLERRVATLCGAGAALLGIAGLVGWGFGTPVLTRIAAGYKAIAPSVAVFLIILGLVLRRLAAGGAGRRERVVSAAVVGFISLYGLLDFIGFLVGADLNREDALTQYLASVSSVPFETMSPVAGALLFLTGAAMLALLPVAIPDRTRRSLRDAACVLGLVAAAVALIFALGYAYGRPLLYGGPAIPISLTGAVGGFLLAVGTVAAAGRDQWPLRVLVGDSARARLLRAFVPLAVFAALTVSVADHRLAAGQNPSHILVGSILAVLFALLAGVVAYGVAGAIGETIDQAQAARQRAEEALAGEARLLDAIVENTEAHLVYLDRDFNFIWVNSAYARACRRPKEAFPGHNHFEFYPHAENEAIFRMARDTGEPVRYIEKPFVFPDMPERGVTYWDWTLTPLKDERGDVYALVFSLADVTERVEQREKVVAAERTRAELAETLNREIGHRVKNNLAMTAGLLQMQIAGERNPQVVATLQDTIARLYAFADVHEQLGTTSGGDLELLGTLRRVAGSIGSVLPRENVVVSVDGDEVTYSASIGTTLCIIANELLTNAVKHGAPGPDGRLRVRARLALSDGRLSFSVWNSGDPVAADLDLGRQSSMGISLVQSLVVAQYRGLFTLEPDGGGTMARVMLSDEALRESA
jgi:PAS domain S-box-containing protein